MMNDSDRDDLPARWASLPPHVRRSLLQWEQLLTQPFFAERPEDYCRVEGLGAYCMRPKGHYGDHAYELKPASGEGPAWSGAWSNFES